MATTLATLERQIRRHLGLSIGYDAEWTQDELIEHLNAAARELWRAVFDLNQDHFLTVDETNVSQAASTKTLTGVPADLNTVVRLRPRDLAAYPSTEYEPRAIGHPDFEAGRSRAAIDAAGATIYFAITAAGGPVAAPTIHVSPLITSAMLLTLIYIPTLAVLTSTSDNPIPGESDYAMVCFATAHALAKKHKERLPSAGWLVLYEKAKATLLAGLVPRQVQEPKVVEGMFEGYGGSDWF